MCIGGWWRAHRSHPFSHTPWECPLQPPAAPGSHLQKQQLLWTSVSPEVTMELDSHHSHISTQLAKLFQVLLWEIWWASECSSPAHPGTPHLYLRDSRTFSSQTLLSVAPSSALCRECSWTSSNTPFPEQCGSQHRQLAVPIIN